MESARLSKFESQLRDLIIKEEINQPLLFRGIHKNWAPCTWSLEDWGKLFRNEKLSIRYARRQWDGRQPQWESECSRADLTWNQITDWSKGNYQFLPQNGSPNDVWIYYDYRYLPDIFQSPSKDEKERDFLKVITFNENLKKKFSWSKLGFPERNSDHSTLWVGSTGSYTPCHFDTYSCNLICQVFGSKRWILFPPTDTQNLLPTRIPYEESSVYSQINFASPKRLVSHSQDLEKCTPFEVTLEAGDCLFLPPKWWHYVQSENFSISVNTWIELPGDHSTRVDEAILRSITSTVVNMTFPDATKHILNPNEMDVADLSELELNEMLQSAVCAYLESQRTKMINDTTVDKDTNRDNEVQVNVNVDATNSNSDSDAHQDPQNDHLPPHPPPTKKCKLNLLDQELSLAEFISQHSIVKIVPPSTWTSILQKTQEIHELRPINNNNPSNSNSSTDERSHTYLQHLINAIGHPSVIKQISEQFLKNISQNPPK